MKPNKNMSWIQSSQIIEVGFATWTHDQRMMSLLLLTKPPCLAAPPLYHRPATRSIKHPNVAHPAHSDAAVVTVTVVSNNVSDRLSYTDDVSISVWGGCMDFSPILFDTLGNSQESSIVSIQAPSNHIYSTASFGIFSVNSLCAGRR